MPSRYDRRRLSALEGVQGRGSPTSRCKPDPDRQSHQRPASVPCAEREPGHVRTPPEGSCGNSSARRSSSCGGSGLSEGYPRNRVETRSHLVLSGGRRHSRGCSPLAYLQAASAQTGAPLPGEGHGKRSQALAPRDPFTMPYSIKESAASGRRAHYRPSRASSCATQPMPSSCSFQGVGAAACSSQPIIW